MTILNIEEEELDHSYIAGINARWTATYLNSLRGFHKVKHPLPYNPKIPLLGS